MVTSNETFLTQTFWLAVFYFLFVVSSILQKMASETLVTEQFQFLGIEVKDEVLAKCKCLFAEGFFTSIIRSVSKRCRQTLPVNYMFQGCFTLEFVTFQRCKFMRWVRHWCWKSNRTMDGIQLKPPKWCGAYYGELRCLCEEGIFQAGCKLSERAC